MAEYHRYVFNNQTRKFVGQFEEMYKSEQIKGFDSWQQDDLRHLDRKICLSILDQFTYSKILDVGCGKGSFTQFLKKCNNNVTGIDISATAIERAKARYSDIDFKKVDISVADWDQLIGGGGYDLIICLELLSYIENWRMLLGKFSEMASYILIKLFIPENPIGYVKDVDSLFKEFSICYEVLEDVRLINRKMYILFGRSLNFIDNK